jgi:hypothetical protein
MKRLLLLPLLALPLFALSCETNQTTTEPEVADSNALFARQSPDRDGDRLICVKELREVECRIGTSCPNPRLACTDDRDGTCPLGFSLEGDSWVGPCLEDAAIPPIPNP